MTMPEKSNALDQVAQELRDDWGIEFRRVQALVCAILKQNGEDLNALLPRSRLSYRSAEQVLRRLSEWIAMKDDQVSYLSPHAGALKELFECAELGDLAETTPPPDLLPTMTEIIREAPRPKRRLDQVQATPETATKRALFLNSEFYLPDRNVLFLGDHDLTSVAIALLNTGAKVFVADIDEELLEYLAFLSIRHDLDLQLRYCDFRLELPRSIAGQCDLVFSDPPYTPVGFEIFCKRALESLGHPRGRVIMAYGHSERHPALGYRVQSVFHKLRFVIEAIYPQFNRYFGAPAIGGTADLYVLRPTRRSKPAAESIEPVTNIYSKGGRAVEGMELTLSDLAESTVLDFQEKFQGEGHFVDLVGEWRHPALSSSKSADLSDYLQETYQKVRGGNARASIFNLMPNFGGYALRIPFVSTAEWLVMVAPFRVIDDYLVRGKVRTLIEAVYRIEEIRRVGKESVVSMQRQESPPSDRERAIVHSIANLRQAKLLNAWREALIAWYKKNCNVSITKRQAKGAILKTATGKLHSAGYLNELSIFALKRFADDIQSTFLELDQVTGVARST